MGERDLFKINRYTMADTYDYSCGNLASVKVKGCIKYGAKSTFNSRLINKDSVVHTCDNVALTNKSDYQKGTTAYI